MASEGTASEIGNFSELDFDTDVGEEEFGEYEHYETGEEESIYDTNDFISGPVLSVQSTLPVEILEFHHSFGYDCKKLFNLTCPEENILIFVSGNLICFFNTISREITFRRSAFGEGVGHITKNPNPNYSHIAVAENGYNPPIIIYEWPTLEIVCLLKGGSSRRFSHVAYSPSGEMFASQGGEPDYMITVWNWKKHRIMLRTKSYVNDVYNLMFSPTVSGQLATSGLGHIKFWKMAETFTGLKLQGDVGRFGKTEISDIYGMYPMPDEKVVSGCDWGNILIWDEGLISKEVTRKQSKRCHGGAITQFDYINGELMTIAKDGWVRMWYFETIDQADPPETHRFVQSEPSYEFHVSESKNVKTELMCLVRKTDNPEIQEWYAQDGNGGLLLTDLTTDVDEPPPATRLLRCHAGSIVAVASSPYTNHMVTFGVDGRLQFYNYINKELLYIKQFKANGTTMTWLPLKHDNSGTVIILAFNDGVIRVVAVNLHEIDTKKFNANNSITLIHVTKPHNKPITYISLSDHCALLATAGEDKTVFVFHLVIKKDHFTRLDPIGYIFTPSIPTHITWKPKQHTTALISCTGGEFLEAEFPHGPHPNETEVTYLLKSVKVKTNRFVSVKSQIRREIFLQEINARKEEKNIKKRQELARLKADNPGISVDEDLFLADSESEEELEPVFVPKIPNPILFAMYTPENTIWLSMGGFDAGYIYEYTIDKPEPLQSTMIYEADDVEIQTFLFDHTHTYLIFGMNNGQIRLNRYNFNNFRDLTDYWKLSMHDNFNGKISNLCFSHDYQYLFSCGSDGNIFSYKFNSEVDEHPRTPPIFLPFTERKPVEDIESSCPSLEEAKTQAEYDRKMRVANERKEKVLEELRALTIDFRKLLQKNKHLLPSQVIPHDEFLLDERITNDFENSLTTQINLVHRKLAFAVEKSFLAYQKVMDYYITPLEMYPFQVMSMNQTNYLYVFRQRKLNEQYYESRKLLQKKIEEAEARARKPKVDMGDHGPPPALEKMVAPIESFLMGLSPSTIEFRLTAKINRLLKKYRLRRQQLDMRHNEWEELYALKPVEGKNHPDDEVAIEQAKKTIGDFKLKSASDYKPGEKRATTLTKYQQLLDLREEIFILRSNFNTKVFNLRQQKVEIIEKIKELNSQLVQIHSEIPISRIRTPPPIPVIDYDNEFPEEKLKVVVNMPEDTSIRRKIKKKKEVVNPVDYELQIIPIKDQMSLDSIATETYTREMNMSDVTMITLRQFAADADVETPWESELGRIRINRKLYEQDSIIDEIKRLTTSFDEDLNGLVNERFLTHVLTTFKDHFLTTLHQELIILKEFEAMEEFLSERVQDKKDEVFDLDSQIKYLLNRIEMRKREIEQCAEKEKEIQQQFNAAVVDNKFLDYLKRIFKKKYRPPKIRSEDDESESSSSESSSSEEEEGDEEESLDEKAIGLLKLDENVCPEGCDLAIYELTFKLRSFRHLQEQTIKEEQKNIEQNKKEIDDIKKKKRVVEGHLSIATEKLEMYQREKQRRLNEVECLLVLKIDQIRNFTHDNKLTPLRNSLVFTKSTLESLDGRIEELQKETMEHKAKHKKNKQHLTRMKTDCTYMGKEIENLNAEIKNIMKIKFGRLIDIEELESTVLRRLVHDLRVSMIDIQKEYEKQLLEKKDKFLRKQIELSQAIQENTERLNLLVVLEEEKNKLGDMLKFQRENMETFDPNATEKFTQDIDRLQRIVKTQQLQIQALKDEISILKSKTGGVVEAKPMRALSPEELRAIEEEQNKIREEIEIYRILEQLLQNSVEKCSKEMCQQIIELMYELYVVLREEIRDNEVLIKKILHHTITDIFEAHEREQEHFAASINKIIENIVSYLPNDDPDVRDYIFDIIGDALWHLRSGVAKKRGSQESIATSQVVTVTDLNEVANDIMKDIASSALSGEINQLQPCIERVIIKALEFLPPQQILKGKNIETIIKCINDKIQVNQTETSPRLCLDKMKENILSHIPETKSVLLEIEKILNTLITKYLHGELLPDLDKK